MQEKTSTFISHACTVAQRSASRRPLPGLPLWKVTAAFCTSFSEDINSFEAFWSLEGDVQHVGNRKPAVGFFLVVIVLIVVYSHFYYYSYHFISIHHLS